MVEVANIAAAHRQPKSAAPQTNVSVRHHSGPLPLGDISRTPWRDLAERAVEPNGYHLADWQLPVNASARDRTGASTLAAWSKPGTNTPQLDGLLPTISMWQAYGIPLPALVGADPYGSLGTPLLDRTAADDSAAALLEQARSAGASALILRNITLDGKALKAFSNALERESLRPRVLQFHTRACLDATRDADLLLREALGAKKYKELRRQRNRLADHGTVVFDVARTADQVERAVETFLTLEASGWKGQRGTALLQHPGDATFIRTAAPMLAARGKCEIISLRAGDTPVASAVVLRHQDRAFYFKLGVDERFGKFSPGVQLTLDLTRHLCADPSIASADSTANAGHSMIEPIWRERLRIGDVLLPLRHHDPMVSMIHAAIAARASVREPARRILHAVRKYREKFK